MFGWGKKKYKLGIALGGGGARGFAHLGVLQALKEKGIEPDVIAGVSAGAIAGAFIASGKTPKEAFETIKRYKYFDISKLRIPRTGLFRLDTLGQSIEMEIGIVNIEDLKTPLLVATSNLYQGRVEYFAAGSLSQLVQASSAIPVLFNPVQIGDSLYCDGGIFDNLPIEPLENICQKTIAINISPVQEIGELRNLAQVASRMFQLAVSSGISEKKKRCNLYIELHELRKYDVLDTKHAQEIYDIGYKHTKDLDISL